MKVTYGNIQEPLVYVQDAVAKGSLFEGHKAEKIVGDPEGKQKMARDFFFF